MTKVQFIERDGQPAFAVVPIEVWDRVKHLVEELEDEALFAQSKVQDDGERIPAAVLDAELAGDHPVRAWRNHRRLTQDALATAAGISKPYLSQIETRQRVGTTDALAKIARALSVSIAVLVEPTAEKE